MTNHSRNGTLGILLLIIAVAATAAPSDSDSLTFWGIQTHFGQGKRDLDSVMNLLQSAGIRAIRDEVYWNEIEISPGTFTFQSKHDAYVNAALARGIEPLIILDYGNDLYGGTPRDSVSRQAFARYCKAVVGRYAPLGVKHYEIWNEPNVCIPGFCPWSPAPNPAEYCELLKAAFAACKSVDPTVVIIACATSPVDEAETTQKIPGDAFIQRVFDLGGGNFMDAVSFHQYPVARKPEEWLPAECEHVRTAMGVQIKPMWITEIGHHTSSAWGSVPEQTQAQYIARTFLVGRTVQGLDRITWYDLMDDCSDGANPECRFGILHEDKSPKPAFLALKAVLTLIGDRPLVTNASNPSSGVYQLRFGAGSDVRIAVWTDGGSASVRVMVPSSFVRVYNMWGKVLSIASAAEGMATVSASPSPLYLVPVTEEIQIRGTADHSARLHH